MRQGMRGAVLGAALLPGLAMAGTPGEEANRCTRFLNGLAHQDTQQVLDVLAERYRPGEAPQRYLDATRLLVEKWNGETAAQNGIAQINPLDDVVVPATGDIVRHQQWLTGKGNRVYFGCVMFSGSGDGWLLDARSGDDDAEVVETLKRHVTAGKNTD